MKYHQLISAIAKLSADDLEKLKEDIFKISAKPGSQQSDLRELLAKGPVMSDEQYSNFLEYRENFRQWRRS